jgi:hypothetical protein
MDAILIKIKRRKKMSKNGYSELSLKSCPFCGAGVFLHKEPAWNGSHGYRGNYIYYVGCTNPDCAVRPTTKKSDDIYRTEEEAREKIINYWNNRKGEGK